MVSREELDKMILAKRVIRESREFKELTYDSKLDVLISLMQNIHEEREKLQKEDYERDKYERS